MHSEIIHAEPTLWHAVVHGDGDVRALHDNERPIAA
jgi:hypothetical protein